MDKQAATESPSERFSDGLGGEEAVGRSKKARRTCLTQNACTRCRLKKTKCDGKRVVCGRCEKDGTECVYDIAQEGITRMQDYQQRLGSTTEEVARLRALFRVLKEGTDFQATELLARLRIEADYEEYVSDVLKELEYVVVSHHHIASLPSTRCSVRDGNSHANADRSQGGPAESATRSDTSSVSGRHLSIGQESSWDFCGVQPRADDHTLARASSSHEMLGDASLGSHSTSSRGPLTLSRDLYVPEQRRDPWGMLPEHHSYYGTWS